MKLNLTDEQEFQVERYYLTADADARQQIFELTRQKLTEFKQGSLKQAKKLGMLLAVGTAVTNLPVPKELSGFGNYDPSVTDKDVIACLKAYDLRRFNREVQQKKDQRKHRRINK